MFDTLWVADLDADAACAALVEAHRGVLEAEARVLALAGHWADLHNGDAVDSQGRALPGLEAAKRLGGPGTPRVAEFAAAEFGALVGMGHVAASAHLRDTLDLRHRHPVMWAAVFAGGARVWQAREVARMVHAADLELKQARRVDAATTKYLASLPWARFVALVEAKIIEADPAAAEERRRAAALAQFVRTGRSNEFGLKTLVAKATAGDVIFFVAMCDRIAQILAMQGDTDPVDARRSKAVGILATPARALALLASVVNLDDAADGLPDPAAADPDPTSPAPGDSLLGALGAEDANVTSSGANDGRDDGHGESVGDGLELVGEGDVHPSRNDADDPTPVRQACPTCRGAGTVSGDLAAFVKPGLAGIDPRLLLPQATLYVHIARESMADPGRGVARVEGVGPVTVPQAQEFLRHTNVTLKPVIDLAEDTAVDAWEVPTRIREQIVVRSPVCVFP
ncbi:MAG: hypothetical protein ACRDPJ_06590, partial [Nocardioidaceae bacterium]